MHLTERGQRSTNTAIYCYEPSPVHTALSSRKKPYLEVTWRGTYSRANAFLKCDNLEMPTWIRLLPLTRKNEDKWTDDFHAILSVQNCTRQATAFFLFLRKRLFHTSTRFTRHATASFVSRLPRAQTQSNQLVCVQNAT